MSVFAAGVVVEVEIDRGELVVMVVVCSVGLEVEEEIGVVVGVDIEVVVGMDIEVVVVGVGVDACF